MVTKVENLMVNNGVSLADLATLRSIFIGSVQSFPFQPSEPWWIPLAGQTISKLTNPEYAPLFAKFGIASNTMTLPDDRGRVEAGLDNQGGSAANRVTSKPGGVNGLVVNSSGGNEQHQLTLDQLAAHDHSGETGDGGAVTPRLRSQASPTSITTAVNGQILLGTNNNTGDFYNAIEAIPDHSHAISSAGSNQSHNNMQPTIMRYKCILAY